MTTRNEPTPETRRDVSAEAESAPAGSPGNESSSEQKETPVQDLVVLVDDLPGELRRVTHTLGHAGINIEGMAALTGEGRSVIHVLVGEPERALLSLAGAGIDARAVHDAVVVNLADRPDALAGCLQPLGEAGINVTLAYMAVGARSQTRVVLVTDDAPSARALLAEAQWDA